MTWLEKMVEIGATPDRTASEEEIIGYERVLGVQFPQSFREFLTRGARTPRPLAADGCSISLFPNNRSPNIAKIFPKRIVGNIRSIEFNFLRPNHLAIVSLWIGLARQ